MSSSYQVVSCDGSTTTTYVAMTKKVFKYNHNIWYAKFVNGLPVVAKYAEVDYTVDLEIDVYSIGVDELPCAMLDFNDGSAKVVATGSMVMDAEPENMFCLEFSSEVLNRHTTLEMVPRPLGDGGIDVE